MARTHGKDTNFSFNGVAIEDELSSVTMDIAVGESDITAFNDTYQNFLAGKPTATVDISGFADLASSQGDATIFGELGLEGEEWDFEPDGSTGYNGFAIVTSYSITSTVGGPITYTASFRHNGGSAALDAAAPTRA